MGRSWWIRGLRGRWMNGWVVFGVWVRRAVLHMGGAIDIRDYPV